MAQTHGSLTEQLAPPGERIRATQGLVRPISQVLLDCAADDAAQVIQDVRTVVLRWVEGKAGRKLPEEAWKGDPFELAEVGAQRAEAVRLDDYWAARVDDADKEVARRTWVTEIALARDGDTVLFGTRLFSVTRGEDVPSGRSVPAFVREVAAAGEFRLDGHPVRTEPWVVDSSEEVQRLATLLISPSRRHTVVVFSLPDGSEDPGDTALRVEPVLRRTIGAAHLAILTSSASYDLTSLLGKEFSVFRGSVRTYRPGLDPETSDPAEHPFALAHRIETGPGGPGGFSNLVVNGMLRSTVESSNLEGELPPYSRVKQAARERARRARVEGGAPDRELLELVQQENAELVQRLEEQEGTFAGLLTEAERERDEAQGQLNEARSRIFALNARLEHLEARLANAAGTAQAIEIPGALDELEDWGDRHLAGRVVLHSRAIRAARKSVFEDVELVYKALLLLRDYYVPMRREGGTDRREAFLSKLKDLHLDEAPCFKGPGAGEQGDAYFVQFKGRRCELDRHLKGSDSRDPRFGFRLYFFWDEETEQVVVGSLPNHLETRIT